MITTNRDAYSIWITSAIEKKMLQILRKNFSLAAKDVTGALMFVLSRRENFVGHCCFANNSLRDFV